LASSIRIYQDARCSEYQIIILINIVLHKKVLVPVARFSATFRCCIIISYLLQC